MDSGLNSMRVSRKTVLYQSVGSQISLFDVEAEAATLTKRSSVELSVNVQYAWPHPSGETLYVVSSNAGPGSSGIRGSIHRANAFRINPLSGELMPHGHTLSLASRPIHASVDHSGEYLLIAYNNPSNVTVHRIEADGSLGQEIGQPEKLDTGIFAHQILTTPGNETAILVTRGNDAAAGKSEDPGALKIYDFNSGKLRNRASVQPGNGLGFGPRHLDFHPTGPWMFVSVERQNQLYVYALQPNGSVSKEPLFVKTSLAEPNNVRGLQQAGAIHVHPNGHFVYQSNRNSTTTQVQGQRVFAGGENNIAVFSIDQVSGEPTLIEHVDVPANHVRTFSLDPSGRILVAANTLPISMPDGAVLNAALVIYRVREDGTLQYMRKYDVDTAGGAQWWSRIVGLPKF